MTSCLKSKNAAASGGRNGVARVLIFGSPTSKQYFAQPLLRGLVFFSRYAESRAYFDLTVETVAKALHHKGQASQSVTVVVDGLRGRDINRFKTSLRHRQVNVRKVRGVRDESEPIIRLADAIAGFVRDYLEGQSYALKLYEKAIKEGLLCDL